MPAIPFSSGSVITGVGGKLYIFPISTLNIYKIEAVVIFRDTSTETWESVAKGSFSEIWVLLSAVTLDEDFYHFISGNIVYVFVKTSADNALNRLNIKRKRGFRRAASSGAKFDVYDHHLSVLLDYSVKFFSESRGIRLDKGVKRRIEEFENLNIEPV